MEHSFYFIRHGQTDLNAKNDLHNNEDVALNATGRLQAEKARSIIETLPISTICVSPLKRTLETAEIISINLKKPKVIIHDLRECTGTDWLNMMAWKPSSYAFDQQTKFFLDRALKGINESLKHEGPVLIVAHGGVHWALCHHFNIQGHHRVIDNCVAVHVARVQNHWTAKTL